MSRIRFILGAALLCACTLLVSGCWDLKELQDRNIVLAIAIDRADLKTPDAQVQTYVQKSGGKEYRLSLQIVKLTPSSGDQPPSKSSKTFIYSDSGKSMFEMIRGILGQSSKALYFGHLDAIVISEQALSADGLAPLLDFFRRNPQVRWRVKVLVTPGNARKILEMPTPTGEPGGKYLKGIVDNHKNDLHMLGKEADLGEISQILDNHHDLLIPRIEATDRVIKVGGTALFKQDHFICYANEYVTRGLKLLTGRENSGVIPVDWPGHPGEQLVFEIFQHDNRLLPHVDDQGQVYFTLEINLTGNLGEITGPTSPSVKNPAFISQFEQTVAKEVQDNVRYSLHFLQAKRLDPLNFKGKFKDYHPFVWKELKDRWDEIYPTMPVYISVHVSVKQFGEHD
jgi:spore germination protein KC